MAAINTAIPRDIVAYASGYNPARCDMNATTETVSRRLQNSTYSAIMSGVLNQDRSAENPPTSQLATLSSADTTYVKNQLDPKLGTGNTMSSYTPAAYTASQSSVSFTTAPSLGSKTTTSVTLNFQSDNDFGEVACAIYNKYSNSEYTSNDNYKPSQ